MAQIDTNTLQVELRKQAVVGLGDGKVEVIAMTPAEYQRLLDLANRAGDTPYEQPVTKDTRRWRKQRARARERNERDQIRQLKRGRHAEHERNRLNKLARKSSVGRHMNIPVLTGPSNTFKNFRFGG